MFHCHDESRNIIFFTPTVDPSQFHNVKVPVIAGYHTEVKEVSAEPITREDRIVNVNYVQNGRIIPVDEDGKEIEQELLRHHCAS